MLNQQLDIKEEDPLIPLLRQYDHVEPSARVKTVCDAISARHKGHVLGFVYYGSSLRDMNNADKMLDFYVVVDSYRKTHKNPIRAVLNTAIPPAVYYHEMVHDDGVLTTCKYSLISIRAFENRATKKAFLSTVWGRFSQPCVLLFPRNASIESRLMLARANAIRHIASETVPLIMGRVDTLTFWARAFRESYRTELRPESSDSRSKEIVARYKSRYDAIMGLFFGEADENECYAPPAVIPSMRQWYRLRWAMRRILGKPMTAIRLLNNAATFDGGLEYVLRKLKNHSGVTINPSAFQRKHPVICAPVLGWKLWRKGAFR